MDTSYVAYCASCSHQLGVVSRYHVAVANGQVHASVTGHPVDLVDADNWQPVEKLYGEPSLPLWE